MDKRWCWGLRTFTVGLQCNETDGASHPNIKVSHQIDAIQTIILFLFKFVQFSRPVLS